ncbi:AAA family ATPase [Methylocystis sp. H62]|uniref:AAA family ATPase n=1 Tax=Methylocystis sp. H62 TaxID=2785789 RepID=UPI0018C2CACF|nr:AAA family ATPase [Methylocystis sp. H62]MBG0795907.1 AAA family ATPase [Methylocystis sp. H62]
MNADPSAFAEAAREWREQREKPAAVRLVSAEPILDASDAISIAEPEYVRRDQEAIGEKIGQTNYGDEKKIELPIVCASDLDPEKAPHRRWHVADLIPAANVTILSGDGATGKSLLALQLAAATATGTEWIGTAPAPGRVLFLSAEDELDELHRRLAAINRERADLSELFICPLAGADAVMASPTPRDGLLAETPIFAALKREANKLKPALIVLDTLADIFGGDEIKKVHARQFIAMLRGVALENDAAIVLLSHPSLSGMASGSGTSGNTAWNNSVRSRLYFERRKNADGSEDDTDIRSLSVKKANRAASGAPIVVRYSDGRFVLDKDCSSSSEQERRAERVFLSLLAQFDSEGRAVSHLPSNAYAPALFAKHQNAERLGKAKLSAAMDRLFAKAAIRVEETGPPSKRRQRIVAAQKLETQETENSR